MVLAQLAMLVLLCQNAMGMQKNARSLHQHEDTRIYCDMYANISAVAQKICDLFGDQHAAHVKDHRELIIDDQANIDFQTYRSLQAELEKSQHISESRDLRHLLQGLKLRQVDQQQRSKAILAPRLDLDKKDEGSVSIDVRQSRLSSTVIFLVLCGCICSSVFLCSSLYTCCHNRWDLPNENDVAIEAVRTHATAKHTRDPVRGGLHSSEYYVDKCGKAFAAIVGLFFVIRICFRIHDVHTLQLNWKGSAAYVFEWWLMPLIVLMVVFTWGVSNAWSKHLEDTRLQLDKKPKIKKKCATCDCYSCYLRS
jgi:hypothetical protein